MKKIFISIILTFALLILSNVESNGQCETGYTSQTITTNIGGCDYVVKFCYKCPEPTSHWPDGDGYIVPIEYTKIPTDPPCENGMNHEEIHTYLYNFMHTGQFIWYFTCLYHNQAIPPCGGDENESRIMYHVLWANCWKLDHTEVYGSPTTGMVPCGTSSCRTYTSYCFHNGNLEIVQQSNNPEGPPPNCPLISGPIVFGMCYRFPNPCYP